MDVRFLNLVFFAWVFSVFLWKVPCKMSFIRVRFLDVNKVPCKIAFMRLRFLDFGSSDIVWCLGKVTCKMSCIKGYIPEILCRDGHRMTSPDILRRYLTSLQLGRPILMQDEC